MRHIVQTLIIAAAMAISGLAMAQSSETTAAKQTAAPAATAVASAMPSCPGDTVVWVNTKTKVEHAQASKIFGKTKHGTYMCHKAADAAGNHMSKNGD